MRRAAGAALAIAVSVSTATLAQAACTPGAIDATTPAPGTTVTCDVTTLNQNPSSGYGTGIQTGITIDVLNGATVQGTGGTVGGIWVGDATIRNGVGASILGATDGIVAATGSLIVTNNGMIAGTTGTGIGAATGVTLTNQAGASISGGTNGVVSTAGAITVDNAGSIAATSGAAINASADVTVTNRDGGVLRWDARRILTRWQHHPRQCRKHHERGRRGDCFGQPG